MSKKYQPPNYQELCLYCYSCQRNINGGECRENGDRKPLSKCKHKGKKVYKAYLPDPKRKGKRITRALEAETREEAIIELINIKKSLDAQENAIPIIEKKVIEKRNNYNLKQQMSRYVGFISGDPEIAPSFIHPKSKGHIRDVKRTFKQITALFGKSVETMSAKELTTMQAGQFRDYLLKNLQLQGRSFNKAKTIFSSFYKYLSDFEKIDVKNPFSIVPQEPTNTNFEIPTNQELQLILEALEKPELGICRVGKKDPQNKILFRPWLRDGTELLVETGRRSEEVVKMRWNNYHESAEGSYVQIPDYKVNRIKHLEGDKEKFVFVPVTASLKELLLRLGLEEFRGQDRYILAPNDPMDRDILNRFFTRAFTHYRKQAGVERDISLKSCRKFYITELVKHAGISTAQLITGHSSTNIMKAAYIYQKKIALSVKDFQPRVKEENNKERENDLEKIREQKSNNKQIEISK